MFTQIRVVSKPIAVKFDCPHCEAEIEMSYSEFIAQQGTCYQGDWSEIECPECEEIIDIDDVDND